MVVGAIPVEEEDEGTQSLLLLLDAAEFVVVVEFIGPCNSSGEGRLSNVNDCDCCCCCDDD